MPCVPRNASRSSSQRPLSHRCNPKIFTMSDPQSFPSAPAPRSKLFRFAIVFALVCAAALAALCFVLPLPAGSGEAGKSTPTFLLFLGRFHPILLHFPVALLVFTA